MEGLLTKILPVDTHRQALLASIIAPCGDRFDRVRFLNHQSFSRRQSDFFPLKHFAGGAAIGLLEVNDIVDDQRLLLPRGRTDCGAEL